MKQNRHNLFLGSFVLAAVALLGGSVTVLGARTLWEDFVMIETYIDESVNGLEKGSAVKFRGITIGRVDRITTVAQVYRTQLPYAYVLIKVYVKNVPKPTGGLSMDDTIEDRVTHGLRMSLAKLGVTGGSYLETDYITDATTAPKLNIDWTPTEVYVPSVPSTLLRIERSFDAVLGKLAETDIEGVVAAARDTLKQFETSMRDLDLAGLSRSTQSLLAKTATAVEGAGEDVDTLSKELTTTIAHIRTRFDSTMKLADQTFSSIDSAVQTAEWKKTFSRFGTVLENADAAVKDLRALATRTNRTVAGVEQIVRGRGRSVEIAIANLREVLQNLNSLTGTLQKYPSLLFVGNPPKPRERKPEVKR